jgi:hypothetical protein
MATSRKIVKPVKYRVAGGPCIDGFVDVGNCDDGNPFVVFSDRAMTVQVAGATLSSGDCPQEVVIVGGSAGGGGGGVITGTVALSGPFPLPVILPPVVPVPLVPVTAALCDGTTVQVPTAQTVQTVPHPTAVQRVVLCRDERRFDREKQLLCNKDTGETVFVLTIFDDQALPGTPPAVEAYTLDGAVYAGAVSELVKCPDVDVESDAIEMCSGGTPFIRWVVKKDGQPTGQAFDTTLGGASYTPDEVVTIGPCPVTEGALRKIFLREYPESFNMPQLRAAVNEEKILSFTVLNVGPGNASLIDDYGNKTTLYPGQIWSWANINDNGSEESFNASEISFNFSGTTLQVTAVTTP